MSSTGEIDNPLIELLNLIAQQESTEVTDLRPLMQVVDGEALKRLLDSDTDVSVKFEYMGYAVYVDSDGTVEIEQLPSE